MRPRVLITPREPFATSPPYRAAQAPDDFPFLERFQHASRKVREDFAFAKLVLIKSISFQMFYASRWIVSSRPDFSTPKMMIADSEEFRTRPKVRAE
jgi:hypothetical protein